MDAETNERWDSTGGNIWCEDWRFDLVWAHTDCIMDAWQSRIWERTVNLRIRIPILQIANIKATMEQFEAKDVDDHPLVMFK